MTRTAKGLDGPTDELVSRRSFLKVTAAAAFGISLSGCGSSKNRPEQTNQLNIFSWADYLHPNTIPEFEKRFGIKVVYDTFSSNEALLAKMQAGAGQYDIIVPSSYMLTQLTKLKLLAEIDHSRLPLLKNLMPRFQDPASDPKLRFSCPYSWGTTGIGFTTDAFPDEKAYPNDWDVFWDERLRGRMTLLDEARECIGMVLKKNGHSYNTTDVGLIGQAGNELKRQKQLVMCYTSDQVIVQLAAGDSHLALAFSGDVYQAAKDNKSLRYVIPKSGASLWLDNFCIPQTAPHLTNAYKWLNFMLEPEIAAANASYTRYATPNQEAFKLLASEVRTDPNLYPSEQLLSRCDALADVGQLIFLYDRLWTELKCT